jgi:HemY protein
VKYLFTILIGLALAMTLAVFLKHDPGYFAVNYAGYTVQMTFALFVIILLVCVVVIFLFLSLVAGTLKLPGKYRRWRKYRSHMRSESNLMHGMQLMLEGNWRKAETRFREGAVYSSVPMVNYLLAARAAQQTGSIQRRDQYLRLAHESGPASSIAPGLTQAELQLNQSQTEQAYATLKHLEEQTPERNQTRQLLLEAGLQLKEWQNVIDLLKQFEKKKYLAPEKIRAGQLQAYAGLLQQAANASTRDKLMEVWKNIPRKLQSDAGLIEIYVSNRLNFPYTSDCETILHRALKKLWHAPLVRLYGLVESVDNSRQLKFAEHMLADHARDPVLLLTLGRLCIRGSLWGKAKTYLEESIEAQPNPDAYQELAALYERQGDHAAAVTFYQEGLKIATGSPGVGAVKMLQHVDEGEIVDD